MQGQPGNWGGGVADGGGGGGWGGMGMGPGAPPPNPTFPPLPGEQAPPPLEQQMQMQMQMPVVAERPMQMQMEMAGPSMIGQPSMLAPKHLTTSKLGEQEGAPGEEQPRWKQCGIPLRYLTLALLLVELLCFLAALYLGGHHFAKFRSMHNPPPKSPVPLLLSAGFLFVGFLGLTSVGFAAYGVLSRRPGPLLPHFVLNILAALIALTLSCGLFAIAVLIKTKPELFQVYFGDLMAKMNEMRGADAAVRNDAGLDTMEARLETAKAGLAKGFIAAASLLLLATAFLIYTTVVTAACSKLMRWENWYNRLQRKSWWQP